MSAVSSVAAMAGSAAFFAPLIRTVPSSLRPPWILNRSMVLFPVPFARVHLRAARFEGLAHVAVGCGEQALSAHRERPLRS